MSNDQVNREDGAREIVKKISDAALELADDGWVTLGRVKIDIETETETFERATTPQLPVKDRIAAIIERCFSAESEGETDTEKNSKEKD